MIWFCRVFVVLLVLSGCSDEEVDPTFVESEFLLEDALYKIETNMYWYRGGSDAL